MKTMLKTLMLALGLSLPVLSFAQSTAQDVPLRIGFQGRLLAGDGTPLAGVKQVTFRIYATPTGGTSRWDETQQLLLTNGYYATFLGATTPLGTTAQPATSVFDGSDLYLGLEVAGAELTPRQRIGSVAYAIRAAHAVHAGEADHAARADVADAVATTWLSVQSVAHADVARSVSGGGNVSANDVQASSMTTAALTATGAVSAGSVSTQNLSATGTVTASTLSASAILHVPGAVVGGAVATYSCTHYFTQTPSSGGSPIQVCDQHAWTCIAWGDGQCDGAGGVNCNGGSHGPGYVRGVMRSNLCIQP